MIDVAVQLEAHITVIRADNDVGIGKTIQAPDIPDEAYKGLILVEGTIESPNLGNRQLPLREDMDSG